MRVEVRGEGIAAYCCVHLLRRAGIETSLRRSARPQVPALLLSPPALQLIRDVFARPELLDGRTPLRKRVVRWDATLPVAELDHLGFVTSEEELLRDLLPASETAFAQHEPDWVVHCASPLPEGVMHRRFGNRKAKAHRVALRKSDACVMESLAGGWLFLLPADEQTGWLLLAGGAALHDSDIVAPRVAEVLDQSGEFPAYPRIASQLTGPNWLACGSAAMGFDPICGDGTALAVRAAILAAAVIRAAARGEDREALLRHYEARVHAGFGRHIDLCRQFYRHGFGGVWWGHECAALDAWQFAAPGDFKYRLAGFDLDPISR